MASAVPLVHGTELDNSTLLFGVRHFSPAGAWHLERFLDKYDPEIVLIEGPSDATELIREFTMPGVTPPVALLCYTSNVPVHSIVYPFAIYSPEYRAITWAKEHNKPCRFIDLPSDIKAPLYRLKELEMIDFNKKRGDTAEPEQGFSNRMEYYAFNNRLYSETAKLGGEEDYETYWERIFEHNMEPDAYARAISVESSGMREMTSVWEQEADSMSFSINLLRESYMKRRINDTIIEGYSPKKIAVIVGAYHISGLMANPSMSDEEIMALPIAATKMTLMPYSYYRLSTFSGYGAGNHAPYYYEMMWKAMNAGGLNSLPMQYLSKLSASIREKNGYCSTASVIESARLAQSLQYMHGGTLPTLKDLHDAAVSVIGGGEKDTLAEHFAAIDVGASIGVLPEGVSQTPVQDDMNRQLSALKLTKYKTVVAQTLNLDLRENRRVKSEEAAFLDLNRSIFLHRINLLGISFASPARRNQDNATWAESWNLCWTPESEIQLVETVLMGDTVEAAAAYALKEKLENAPDVLAVAELVRETCNCGLKDLIPDALKRLQAFASEAENINQVTKAAREMSFLIQYGGIRRFDTDPLIPIFSQLFLKSALLLVPAASCDYTAAKEIASDMSLMHYMTQENNEYINDAIWLKELKHLADNSDKNPLLCGFACSILTERRRIEIDELSVYVSRYLSPGCAPESGAWWFEGLSLRNRGLLLSQRIFWEYLDTYVSDLDSDSFKRTLVCLRRVFSRFEPKEKTGICEVLADIWGLNNPQDELLLDQLNESEQEILDELNDFDFGDLL